MVFETQRERNRMKKALLLSLGFIAVFLAGLMCFRASQHVEAAPPRNLKFYPKSMRQPHIYKEMRRMSQALGVKCKHCHVVTPRKQFAKSTKNKEIALKMLFLTKEINDDLKNIFKAGKRNKVTCYTCHRGNKKPLSEPHEEEEDGD